MRATFPTALSPSGATAFFSQVKDLTGELPLSAEETDVEAIAGQWHRRGLRPGDIVLIALPNSLALLVHTFGVLAAGGVPALMAPSTPTSRQQALMEAFAARALLAGRWPQLEAERLETFELAGARVAMLPPLRPPAALPGEMALLTSGTSGFSSGCVFDVEALLRNASKHADAIGLLPRDTVLVNLPLYFSYAMVAQAFASLVRSARLIVSGPPFSVEGYLRTVAEHSVNVSSLTPVLVRALLQSGQNLPRGLRALTVGGDQLSPAHVERLLALRPEGELYLTYGLSEAGPRVATLAAHQEPAHRFASVGRPLPGTHVALEPGGGGPGELIVSSDTVMKRRIGLVEGASERAPRAPGVLATGDLFEIDREGYLFFQGRLTDFLVRRGEKICTASVRSLASTLPGVLSARTERVAGADGEDYDLILRVAGSAAPPAALDAGLARLLRPGERPRRVHVVPLEEDRALPHK